MYFFLVFFLLLSLYICFFFFFFFNDTATTEIYTLSLHDALPIPRGHPGQRGAGCVSRICRITARVRSRCPSRSEEHTSELQSRPHLVCRLLLEKKKKTTLNSLSQKKKKKINK